MQSTSVSPWHVCYYPIPNPYYYSHKNQNLHLPHNNSRRRITTCFSFNNQTHFTNSSVLNLTATTNSFSKEQENENKNSNPNQNHAFLDQFYSSTDTNNHSNHTQITQIQQNKEETVCEVDNFEGISSNMWWVDFKAALGQRINLEGIVSSVAVVARDRHLALPHVSVRDIRYIDWAELKRKGFQGVVFDKDNTITVPYSLTLFGPLGSSLDRCKSVFGNDIAVFSNSAGLQEYDPEGRKARALECAIGIKVIKHRVKKPAGTAEEIEKHFGCESSRLIMVGDRPFTDIVFGNRNGFLTVLTEPLSLAEEPFIVKQVRKLEVALVNLWCRMGLKPTGHRLLPQPLQCVNDPPPL